HARHVGGQAPVRPDRGDAGRRDRRAGPGGSGAAVAPAPVHAGTAPRGPAAGRCPVSRLIQRRLLQALPVLFGITIVTFSMVHLVPGDPARALAGQRATPVILASIRHRLGVDRPLLAQYWHFVSGLPRGQLGYSFLLHQSTDALVAARLPTTLFLVLY